jgi:hypothetical protein
MRHNRGIPTEEVLAEMRSSDPPIYYLVGTPKGRLSKLEADLLERPWQSVRPGVEVKVLPQENELYLLAQIQDRLNKERAMRRRFVAYSFGRDAANGSKTILKKRRSCFSPNSLWVTQARLSR